MAVETLSMKLKLVTSIAVAALAVTTPAAFAHHSFAAEFDANSPIDLAGVVTKIDWTNPHTYIYIDVENEQGEWEIWGIEMGSPNGLMRRGWTRNSLQIGDEVSVSGTRARDGSYKGNARTVVLASGERMFAGSSQTEDDE
jgi:hypothetical protein